MNSLPKTTQLPFHYHFIGIGGIGMSGLARILIQKGYRVSGSDGALNTQTRELEEMGAVIYTPQREEHVPLSATVIYSHAIAENNPEFAISRARKQKMLNRAELLDQIARIPAYNAVSHPRNPIKTLAVTGTHGKTTTSSLMTHLLQTAGKDPTYIVGGVLKKTGTNANLGTGDYCVYEACEAFGSIYSYQPDVYILLNIDDDHMEYYHTMDQLMEAFAHALNRLPEHGWCVVNADDDRIQQMLPQIRSKVLSFGLHSKAQYRVDHITPRMDGMSFDLYWDHHMVRDLHIPLYGTHHVSNSTAVIVCCLQLGLSEAEIRAGLTSFVNSDRRFTLLRQTPALKIVDDYAHHPTEIAATLDTALLWKDFHSEVQRIVAVFQPHLYTRTRDHFQEFARILSKADVVVVLPIYPSREEPIPGVTSELIQTCLRREMSKKNSQLIEPKEAGFQSLYTSVSDGLRKIIQQGDLILFMGAGDITTVARRFAEEWLTSESPSGPLR